MTAHRWARRRLRLFGIGPVTGIVRWSQEDKFGIQFSEAFELARLAPPKPRSNDAKLLKPWYVDNQATG